MKIGEVRGGPAAWRMRSPGDQSLPKLKVEGAIRCTVPSCSCECFTPGKINIRYCDGCNHSWVPHALDKLGEQQAAPSVEPVQPNAAFDIASLVLYGCQALPIRLKILLDRLFSVLRREEVLQVLAGFGWTQDDYARGYILQDANCPKSETWNICSSEEEPLVLRQFLRFGETRSIAMELLQSSGGHRYQKPVNSKAVVKDQSKPPTPQPTSPVLPIASTLSTSSTQSSAQQTGIPLDFRVQNTHKVTNNRLPIFTNAYSAAAFNMSALLSKPNVALNLFGATSPTKMNHHSHMMSNSESLVTSSFPVTSSVGKAGSEKPISVCDEDATQGVLNLSRDAAAESKTQSGSPRKQPGSSRRPWSLSMPGIPLNLGTQLVNQVTGKKRVQCNVCMKTFCDKGALKIHFSAVHLREMHKCTVDGCNMMFSSRRSRNRHSANPNPKLHSPHMRRKMSPHDGRSALAHTSPRLGDIAPMGQLAFPMLPTAQLQPTSNLRSPRFEEMRHNDLTNNNTTFSEESSKHFNNQQDDDETMDERDDIVVDYSAESEMFDEFDRYDSKVSESRRRMTSVSSYSDEESLTKQEDSEDGDVPTPAENQVVRDESILPTDLSSSRSSHKRKSNHPTKCSNAQEPRIAQRIDDRDVMDDEDSKSVGADLRVKELGELIRQDGERDDNTENMKSENEDVVSNDTSGNYSKTQNCEQEMHKVMGQNDGLMEMDSESTFDNYNQKSGEGGLVIKTEDERNSVNALKHLENLSNGPLSSSGDPRSDDLNSSERSPDYSSAGSQDDDSQFFFPDSGNLFGSVDVPIDKDNPRRCTACGKIFQNHFGVKTHFQNVHLKLLHKCSVDGCNAAFPSKRSRDRHSANANLHRKLLSTSSNSPPFPEQIGMGGLPTGKDLFPFPMSPTLHSQFMSRLYAEAQTPANLEIALKNLQAQMAFNGSGDLSHNDHSLLQPSPAAAAGLLMMSPLVLQDLANLSAHFRSRVNGESLLAASRTTNGQTLNARDLLEASKVSHNSLDLPMP